MTASFESALLSTLGLEYPVAGQPGHLHPVQDHLGAAAHADDDVAAGGGVGIAGAKVDHDAVAAAGVEVEDAVDARLAPGMENVRAGVAGKAVVAQVARNPVV